mgnify:CR=1 FL=1
MLKLSGGRAVAGKPLRQEGEVPGIETRLANFSNALSDIGSLAEPVVPVGRVRGGGIVRSSRGGRSLLVEEDPGRRVGGRPPVRPKSRRGGRGGSGVGGQGGASPGGVYTPNPGI